MHELLLLIVQVLVILTAAYGAGRLVSRFNQPQVVGEMAAGLLLGPSVFGWVAPVSFGALFPAESLPALETLSQVGLLLFMFLIGLELDPGLLRGRVKAAIITSQVSIVVPFALGVGLAAYLHPYLAGTEIPFLGFALFMGAAMSVTAFPVLSRILAERNLLRTRVGVVTLACAAVDDVTAWLLLAGVVALVRSDGGVGLLLTLGGTVGFVALLIGLGRPLLLRLEAYYHSRGRLTQGTFSIVLLLLLASAAATEALGIHALFGAFLIGTVMPKDHGFVREVRSKLEDVTVALLLPLFFAYTGLHTQIGLLDGWVLWRDAVLILLVAVVGKFGGSALAARATGLTWRESGALGVLMNTRGLMELVILSIGLDLGVIPPALFAMMVLMALATTVMTTPALAWIYPLRRMQAERVEAHDEPFVALIPVAFPSSGPALLRVTTALAPPGPARYYALHLTRAHDQSFFSTRLERVGPSPLQALLDAAQDLGVAVRPVMLTSRSVDDDLLAVADAKGADLIVMGYHKPVLSQRILGGVTGTVMRAAPGDVVVCMLRDERPWRRILIPYRAGRHDRRALHLAYRLAGATGAVLTILHVVPGETSEDRPASDVRRHPVLRDAERVELKVVAHDDPVVAACEEAAAGYDLVVVGAEEGWDLEPDFIGLRHERLADVPGVSLLVVRAGRDAEGRQNEAGPGVRSHAGTGPGGLVRKQTL